MHIFFFVVFTFFPLFLTYTNSRKRIIIVRKPDVKCYLFIQARLSENLVARV